MSDYIAHVTSLADTLAVCGSPLSDEEVSLFILGGLGPEYESLVTSITTQATVIDLSDLQGLLMNYEVRLSRLQSAAPIVANYASSDGRNSNSNFRGGRGRGQNYRGGRTNNRGGV